MMQRVSAVFDNGVFRPEVPVQLMNGQRVSLCFETSIDSADDLSDIADLLDVEFMESCQRAPAPDLDEVRSILAAFGGSLAERISEERSER
ncbi:MAG: antitoxin AF2212-like protein [Pirellulales bacterium]